MWHACNVCILYEYVSSCDSRWKTLFWYFDFTKLLNSRCTCINLSWITLDKFYFRFIRMRLNSHQNNARLFYNYFIEPFISLDVTQMATVLYKEILASNSKSCNCSIDLSLIYNFMKKTSSWEWVLKPYNIGKNKKIFRGNRVRFKVYIPFKIKSKYLKKVFRNYSLVSVFSFYLTHFLQFCVILQIFDYYHFK